MKTFNDILQEERKKPYFQYLESYLNYAYDTQVIYPPLYHIFDAFKYCKLKDVKVVIIGQDPYHEENQANGLAFSVTKDCPLPPSLQNIYKELYNDLKITRSTGDLTEWAKQGVLLLNTILTVEEGKANSHKSLGWDIFTNRIINELGQSNKRIVFILWGKQAQAKKKFIKDCHYIIESPHPSPLSAYRGFFNSHPFSKCNKYLEEMNQTGIDWGKE